MVCERGHHAGFLQRKVENIYIPVNSLYPHYTKKMAEKNYNSGFSVIKTSLEFLIKLLDRLTASIVGLPLKS